MDRTQIQAAFDEVLDQAIVFHSFTAYMRDYEVIVYATADPRTGIRPEHVRLLFQHCVQVTTRTAVPPDVWRRSLDERLIDYATGVDLDGYVWGVNWQALYPAGLPGDDQRPAVALFPQARSRSGLPESCSTRTGTFPTSA